MEVLTNRDIYYNNDGKNKKSTDQSWLKKQGAKLKELEKNQLFQTGAAAYGSYLTQRYQGGGFQPLSSQEELGKTSNQLPTVTVTDDTKKPEPKMSLTTKIGIGVGIAAVVGIIIFVVVKNRKKIKK
jgi:hypothetical protein